MFASILAAALALPLDPASAVARLEALTGAAPAPLMHCGGDVVRDVARLWPTLDPALRARVRSALRLPQGPGRDLGQCVAPAPNHLETEHFSVQWGSEAETSEDDHAALAQAMEDALAVYRANGFADPAGIDQVYLRVFVGNSGPEVPGIAGALGYAVSSDFDCPHAYIVIDPSGVADETLRQDVSAHELFHTVQFALDTGFATDDWFSEASAVWAEDLVFPELNVYAGFLTSYVSAPELRLDTHDGGREYGMFHLPKFFDEQRGGLAAIRWFWENTGRFGGAVPAVFEGWLDEGLGSDETFAEAFAEFSARNVVWDYAEGDLYSTVARQVLPTIGRERDFAQVTVVERVVELPLATTRVTEGAPDTYGTAYVSFRLFGIEPPDNQVRITLEAEGGEWVAAVVEQRTDGEVRTRLLPVEDARVEITIESAGTRVSDAVVAFTLVTEEGGPVPFTYGAELVYQPPTTEDLLEHTLDVLDDLEDEAADRAQDLAEDDLDEREQDERDANDEDSGCASPNRGQDGVRDQNACSATPGTGLWWFSLLALTWVIRRRR